MKILTFIFSLYILGLSVFPCADTVAFTQQKQDAIVNIDSHQQNNHTDDHCTPFCICSCCHSNVTLQLFATIIKPVTFQKDFTSNIVQQYISILRTPPDQPPQVVFNFS